MASTDTTHEPKWRRLPEERPRQILDAAFEEFAERGLASARLEDIARRAGVSKGTIYLYFPSKEDLFREVVRHTVGDATDDVARRLNGPTATDDLNMFLDAKWEFVCSDKFPPLHRWVHSELNDYPELARFYGQEVMSKSRQLLRGIIERGIRDGEFRHMDAAVASRMLMALISTYGNWRHKPVLCDSIGNRSDTQLLEEIREFYLTAIRRAPHAHGAHSKSQS